MDACLGSIHAQFSQHDVRSIPAWNHREERRWYALFTIPQNEKAVTRHLAFRGLESFLPTYEVPRIWKNRHRTVGIHPLFPNYVFVHMDRRDRGKVLQTPGVLQVVGNSREPIALPDAEIEFLRSDFCRKRIEPYPELVVGRKVRVRRGIMQGLEGILVRKNNGLRFVLKLALINQQAAVEVCAEDLEPIHP